MPRLDDIRARLAAASPGPWHWTEEKDQWGPTGPDLSTVAVEHTYTINDGSTRTEWYGDAVVSAWGHDAWGITVEPGDADLIAHAPTDLAALTSALDAVMTLHSRNEYDECGHCSGWVSDDQLVRYPCPTVKAITEALEGPQ